MKKLFCLLLALCALFAAGSAEAGDFIIHKVDDTGAPIGGVPFEVYGKPTITTSLEYYKEWRLYQLEYEEMIVPAGDFAPYVELWTTTDPSFDPEKPHRVPLSRYKKAENVPAPTVTEISRGPKKLTYTTVYAIQYRIAYSGLPKYDDSGAELHYVMRENHIVLPVIFGNEAQGILAYGFDPYGIDYNRELSYEEKIALGYSPEYAAAEEILYCYDHPFIMVTVPHARYGVGENGTIINQCANIIESIGLIS